MFNEARQSSEKLLMDSIKPEYESLFSSRFVAREGLRRFFFGDGAQKNLERLQSSKIQFCQVKSSQDSTRF